MNEIDIEENPTKRWIMSMPLLARCLGGAFICGLAAVYIGLCFVVITGRWDRNLLHIGDNSIIACILAAGSLVGRKINRLLVANVLIALVYFCFSAYMFASFYQWKDWLLMYPIAISNIVLPTANYLLFARWNRLYL